MLKHHYLDIQGWFDFQDVYLDMINKASDKAHFVEVGCWLGKSTSFMGVEIKNSGKNIKLDCVDTWTFDPNGSIPKIFFDQAGDVEKLFLGNIKNSNIEDIVTPVKLESTIASRNYEDNSLDFVFIDANHGYEDVKKDIQAWYPKVKPGGYIGGHDYSLFWKGVIQAVDEIFKADKLIMGQSWLHLKK
jgi:predicted O-methyltransferase YrrM